MYQNVVEEERENSFAKAQQVIDCHTMRVDPVRNANFRGCNQGFKSS